MDRRIDRTAETLDGVLLWAKRYPKRIAHAGLEDTIDALRETQQQIQPLRVRLRFLRGPTHRGGQIKIWSRILRRRLQSARSAALAHLKDDSGKPLRIYVPPFKSVTGPLCQAAVDVEALLRPRLAELIAKKVRPTILDELHDGAVQVWLWRKTAPDERQEHKRLLEQMQQHVSHGRQLVAHIRDSLAEDLEDDSKVRTEFESAAKIRGKPGPNPEVVRKKKREATYRKRPKKKLPRSERMEGSMTTEELRAAVADEAFRQLQRQAQRHALQDKAYRRAEQSLA